MSYVAPRLTLRSFPRASTPIRLQRRYARVHDVRFVATQQRTSTIDEKYRAKLEQKAKSEGHESISSLKEAYADKISEHRRAASKPPPGASINTSSPLEPPSPSSSQPQQPTQSSQPPSRGAPGHKVPESGIKPLSSYLDLEKIASLPAKEIELLWRLRHASSPLSLCATIPLDTYRRMYASALQHPQFVLPLPRPASDDGSGDIQTSTDGFGPDAQRTTADVHFLQWGFHPPAKSATPPSGTAAGAGAKSENNHTSTVIFTHLAAFKLHGEHAQPHTTITHHLDLADSHGLVLLNGGVMEGRGVSVDEGRWLLMCLQKFYDFEGHGGGVGRERRQELLKKFSSGDSGFSLEELLDEAERVS
ncbi:uncharacterized protein HMPREF1541_06960 [Cyphellophora europaea CBS 101466]|uniref:ATP11 protein n=1 Tax=Cyphellophora europaea (strain CBS 101466) TaxID=1220924 RepID=W2RT60_CYPE1|nr:uncharacterized protein HMPREF1541_06960 [Cyphellophora europaea CBS 101466]ETN38918.1 hypothetical protein HMPREF1541_06960 [Cyphellophora europaea CBS 101466]